MYIYKSDEYHYVKKAYQPDDIEVFAMKPEKEKSESLLDRVAPFIRCWDNLYIMGGAVLNHVKGYLTNDIDFYIVGCSTPDEYKKRVYALLDCFETFTVKTKFAISGTINNVKVQLVLTHDRSNAEVMDVYDIGICCISYTMVNNNPLIEVNTNFIKSNKTKTIMIDVCYLSTHYSKRLIKYYYKGFNLAVIKNQPYNDVNKNSDGLQYIKDLVDKGERPVSSYVKSVCPEVERLKDKKDGLVKVACKKIKKKLKKTKISNHSDESEEPDYDYESSSDSIPVDTTIANWIDTESSSSSSSEVKEKEVCDYNKGYNLSEFTKDDIEYLDFNALFETTSTVFRYISMCNCTKLRKAAWGIYGDYKIIDRYETILG